LFQYFSQSGKTDLGLMNTGVFPRDSRAQDGLIRGSGPGSLRQPSFNTAGYRRFGADF
jgi:hypothetical protein